METYKTNLLLSTAHGFKSPLTAVKVAYDLLLQLGRGTDDPYYRRAAVALRNAITRLEQTVTRSLTYVDSGTVTSRLETTTGDLKAVLKEAYNETEPLWSARQQQVVMQLPEQDLYMRMADFELSVIFTNLLENSAKYASQSSEINVATTLENGMVRCSISNPGSGLSQEEIECIFEPYYRGSSADRKTAQGVGFGLAIVKRLADANNAEVSIQSTPTGPTTVIVRIPMAACVP